MNPDADNLCLRLDEFLGSEISAAEGDEFASHMAHCEACREAADQQRWIDGLLQSEAAAELEAAPKTAVLLDEGCGNRRTNSATRRRARRRVLAAVVAAGVAALVAASLLPPEEGQPSVASRQDQELGDPAVARARSDADAMVANPSPSPSLRGRRRTGAAFVSAGSSIAIPVASADPRVTVVQLYPTVTATRRWAREAALREFTLPPNGG